MTLASWRANNSLKILAVAAAAGAASGVVCTALRFGLRLLQWIVTGHSGLLAEAAGQLPLWRRAVTPVIGAVIATLFLKTVRKLRGATRPVEYVEAVRFQDGQIPFLTTASLTLASGFSIASGAAIGREGSMIQFAAATISALGNRWKWKLSGLSLARLVALGCAGAVAAVYQAPVAGAFFALEIVLGGMAFSWMALNELPALLIAAAVGASASGVLLGKGPLFPPSTLITWQWHDCLPILLTAAFVGAIGPGYSRLIRGAGFLKRWPGAMIWSGLVVGLLSCLSPETWGNGDSGVLEVVTGRLSLQGAGAILILRLIATAACVGSGVVGGVFTPTVFVGSVLGLYCGAGLHLLSPHTSPVTSYAILTIACLLAAVTHAPLMAAFMTVELTGTPSSLPVVLAASLVSWQIARKVSPRFLYSIATPDPAGNRTSGLGDKKYGNKVVRPEHASP